ncbi:hypothetical protein FIBSPDRAFT_879043 [Athelia psychrophila]|uniref:Uncharacterized protein n=1 Tax=Athelia psychrophila TaxID=1759441 RepID=A0A167UET7_9AGAM|nr:hypothetical protein FIBSPDRAFT_879043 [Fibularhizoctonia sp. CBS 109695]
MFPYACAPAPASLRLSHRTSTASHDTRSPSGLTAVVDTTVAAKPRDEAPRRATTSPCALAVPPAFEVSAVTINSVPAASPRRRVPTHSVNAIAARPEGDRPMNVWVSDNTVKGLQG